MRTLHVKVTPAHFAQGQKGCPSRCPIALALAEAANAQLDHDGLVCPNVYPTYATLSDPFDDRIERAELPAAFCEFIQRFDLRRAQKTNPLPEGDLVFRPYIERGTLQGYYLEEAMKEAVNDPA